MAQNFIIAHHFSLLNLESRNLCDLNALNIGRRKIFVLCTRSTAIQTQMRSHFKGDKYCTSKAKVKLSLSAL